MTAIDRLAAAYAYARKKAWLRLGNKLLELLAGEPAAIVAGERVVMNELFPETKSTDVQTAHEAHQ